MEYNLLKEGWIPVLYADGRPQDELSALDALRGAGGIRRIASSSPLDLFAAHRFLLTLLYWKAEGFGGVEEVRKALLAGRIPEGLIEALEVEARSFELFDEERPFLQDVTLTGRKGERKSAGSMMAECPCGTNVAHFVHSRDSEVRLCLACAARGLVRVVPWTQSGGAGLTPSIHNAPPIMVLATGRSLIETLGLNLVTLACEQGSPQWTGHFRPTDRTGSIPYMEAFTWNPRRVRLLASDEGGTCWACGGEADAMVLGVVYEKNPETASNKSKGKTVPFSWEDPAAFYATDKPCITAKSGDELRASVGADVLALWPKDGVRRATVVEQNPGHRDWQLVVPCTNPANNKSFDHRLVEVHGAFSAAKEKMVLQPSLPPRPVDATGWEYPRLNGRLSGANALVRAARQMLDAGDWQLLRDARGKAMNVSVGAFDVFSGLYWSLRRPGRALPTRETAWLMLKLMAAVPRQYRFATGVECDPLREIANRQLKPAQAYPLGFPEGERLEETLHRIIERGLGRRPKRFVDWAKLCAGIDALKSR